MSTATKIAHAASDESFCQILGIQFFRGDARAAVDRMNRQGGLLVAPAAPALKDLNSNLAYREALIGADLAITDSAYMVLIWNITNRDPIRRVSGLAYLRELLSREATKVQGATFWIMASHESSKRNTEWLQTQCIELKPENIYIAPVYGARIDDAALLRQIQDKRPKHIVITIGGGTQERLGLYLKRSLNYTPAIHCIGAAIAFLSGDQVRIPGWADSLYLGWLFRCLRDPKRYVGRYWAARKLLPLMLRYRQNMPNLEVN